MVMGGGFSHVGVSTHDMDATIQFYEEILGFPRVVEEKIKIKQGGMLRQVFFDLGRNQYIVFMEPSNVPGISDAYDTGINGALGVPSGMYHFAFRVESLDELESQRQEFENQGIEVSSIVDLGIAKSIFLSDPNGIQLEFCCHMRSFSESDLHKESEASIAL
jgi:catechol 2,3-dioxygenase-like lactoylglutathione lyase family enzyme